MVHVKHLVNSSQEEVALPVAIEGLKILINNYWAVPVEAIIPPIARRPAVVIIHSVGVDLSSSIKMLVERLPDPLHGSIIKPLLLVLEV